MNRYIKEDDEPMLVYAPGVKTVARSGDDMGSGAGNGAQPSQQGLQGQGDQSRGGEDPAGAAVTGATLDQIARAEPGGGFSGGDTSEAGGTATTNGIAPTIPTGRMESGGGGSGWSSQQIGPTRDRPGASATFAAALAEQPEPVHFTGERAYKRGLAVARRAVEAAEDRSRQALPPDLEILMFDARFHNSRALAKLHVDSWRATYRGIMPDKVIRALTYRRFEEKWEQLLAQDDPEVFTFMAVEPDLGLLGFLRAGPNEAPDAVARKEIYALNVAPKFQRRGIGGLLLREAFNRILDDALWRVEAGIDAPEDFDDTTFLWVLQANRKTRWFMKSMGGRTAGTGEDMVGSERLPKTAYRWDDLDTALGPDFEPQLQYQSRLLGP